jgi:hypothetical protein
VKPSTSPASGLFLHLITSLSCLSLLTVAALAQSPSVEHTFHASKADVQKALRGVQSYPGGKLPVLDGFADDGGHSLDKFQRGHYQYEVQLKSISPATTSVHIDVKITAWYTDPSPANSGYRVLKSSGRLESDLLDALDERLNPHSAGKTPGASASAHSSTPALPDSPSTVGGGASAFTLSRLTTAPSAAKPASSGITDPATAKRMQALQQEEQNLGQILHDQARPTNLAVVKSPNTPVVTQPQEGAEMLFRATAEDEFEVLDTVEGWVHIKISGISRGWLRRDYVDLPGAATVSLSLMRNDQGDKDKDVVRQTKEEVAQFPGKWEPLDGKKVKIIWVQPLAQDQFGSEPKWNLAKSVFRKADAGSPTDSNQLAGVVVIFDSQDGGMAATTLATLQQWRAGHLTDEAFWKRSWRDPAEAFNAKN